MDAIGFLVGPSDFLPSNASTAFGADSVRAWFAGGGARAQFDRGAAVWSPGGMLRRAAPVLAARGVAMWAYLSQGNTFPGDGGFCAAKTLPLAERHRCHAASGFPLPDPDGSWEWWATLISEGVGLIRELAPPVRHFHLWNEPNAGAWRDHLDNGTEYSDFFSAVSARIHKDNPGVAVGGPVTFCPMTGYYDPKSGAEEGATTWAAFGKQLIDAALPSGQLDFFDSVNTTASASFLA